VERQEVFRGGAAGKVVVDSGALHAAVCCARAKAARQPAAKKTQKTCHCRLLCAGTSVHLARGCLAHWPTRKMSNMGSSHVTTAPEGTTTEWQDILRAKGIIAPAAPTERERRAAISSVLESAAEAAELARDRLAEASVAELDELAAGDDADGERSRVEEYRAARLRALRAAAAAQRFGRLLPLSRDDFVREVTEASKEGGAGAAAGGGGTWVVVLLYKTGIAASATLEALMPRLADRHRATKFMAIVADQCIEGFPDRNVPALLLYHAGVCVEQVVGLAQFGGARATADAVEWVLAQKKVLTTELEEDPRKALDRAAAGGGIFAGRAGAGAGRRRAGGDDDDDEDD